MTQAKALGTLLLALAITAAPTALAQPAEADPGSSTPEARHEPTGASPEASTATTATARTKKPGQAPTPQELKEASAHFTRGVELFRRGAFRASLFELKNAYELVPDYRVLFNIGQTQMQLSQHLEAIDAFEGYLKGGDKELTPDRVQSVQEILAGLYKHAAVITVTASEEGATIRLDGKLLGTAPITEPQRVTIGRHLVQAEMPDGRSASKAVNLVGGDRMDVFVQIEDIEAATGPLSYPIELQRPVERPPTPEQPPETRRYRLGGIVLLGVSAGAALGATAFGLLSSSARDDLDAELKRPDNGSKIGDARSSVKTYSVLTDLTAATAVVSGALGLGLFFGGDERPSREGPSSGKVELGFSPTGVQARGQF